MVELWQKVMAVILGLWYKGKIEIAYPFQKCPNTSRGRGGYGYGGSGYSHYNYIYIIV